MIACSTVIKQDIRSHYDLTTVFYRMLWGRHIHHGLWTEDELATNAVAAKSNVAQQRLTETLAHEAGIQRGENVLDVGCGMGSSSIYLAAKLDCQVTGITISAVQRRWAQWCCALASSYQSDSVSMFRCGANRVSSGSLRRRLEHRVYGAFIRQGALL